jgi:hypothetical protein
MTIPAKALQAGQPPQQHQQQTQQQYPGPVAVLKAQWMALPPLLLLLQHWSWP